MRTPTSFQALSAVIALALLAACSDGGSSAIAPKPASPQGGAHFLLSRVPRFLNQIDRLKINALAARHFVNHYSCPANGSIVYVSDMTNNVINVYSGKFAGQAPCGQVGFGFLYAPVGLYVQAATHDLYAVNTYNSNVQVFHRGKFTPFNTYTSNQVGYPWDVAVAKDGTIIVTTACALNTWIGGPNGGTFVGTFQLPNCDGEFAGWIATQRNATIYYDYVDGQVRPVLWFVSCSAGACGLQTRVWWHVPGYYGAQGMAFDPAGDLLVNNGVADTFELPNPKPSTFPLSGSPWGMAINDRDNHLFVADNNGYADEYSYPSGVLIGTVPVNPGDGAPAGIAVDP